MAQNIENRQRVIFISNATENFYDGIDNLQSLSKKFPNVVFFTDDYDPEHTYSNGHRVNIWKGGQKYIKVHGIKQNSTVNLGNGISITLTLSDNGLLGLSLVSFINNIITLGAVPYNSKQKRNSLVDAEISITGENASGFYSKVGTGSNTKYYISSNVNRLALYLAIQKGTEGEIEPSLSIFNANDLNDKDKNIESVLTPSNQFSGKLISNLAALKVDLGLSGSNNVSSVLRYSDNEITQMLNNNDDPFNLSTTNLPNYEIYRYTIDITKLFEGSTISAFPTTVKSSEVTIDVQDTNDNNFNQISALDLTFNSINFEPFFNEIVTTKDKTDTNGSLQNGSTFTTKLNITPCISSPTNSRVKMLEIDFDTYYNKIFAKYENANYGIKLQIYAYINGNRVNTPIDVSTLNTLYFTVCKELGVTPDPNGCLTVSSLNKPTEQTPYYTVNLTIRNFCDRTIERYLKDRGVVVSGVLTSIYVVGEPYTTGTNTQNLPVSSNFINNKYYLNTDYVYSTGIVLDIASGKFKVGIFVTEHENDSENKVNDDFLTYINNSFNATSNNHVFSVSSFNDFTSDNRTISGGRLVELKDYCKENNISSGWVYLVIPKMFNDKPATQKFNNTLISNNISYRVATDDINNPKIAYFSVIPDEFKNTGLHFDGYDYDVLKVKAPLTGSILLLNNNDSKIISNV